ncbi:hypothetical protein [Flammeovirga pacifica]|nr:hypothetical protein [Flammeovirga pacifica]
MKNKFKKEYNKLNCTTDKKIFIYVYNFLTSKNRYNGLIYKSDRGLNPIDLSLSEYISSPNLDHVFENASFIHELYTYSPIKQQILDFIELLMGNYKDYKRLLDSYSGVGKENIEKYKVSKQALQQKRNNDTKFLKNIIIENALFYLDQKNNKYKLLNKKNKHLSKNTNILRERVQKVVSEFIDNINSEHDTTFYEIK